jgi:pyruvate kinase
LLKNRRTKIVATVGPSSSSSDRLEALIRAGVDVFRLNFSHGRQPDHGAAYARIREVSARLGVRVGVLADLCGPKIRVGTFPGGSVELKSGEQVVVTTRDVVGAPGLIPSQYRELAEDVSPGDRLLLDDGNLELRVEAVAGTEISCRVVEGGVLKDKKGMNLPGIRVSAPSITEKDRSDARFAADLGVDFIALSFVRSASDVRELRGFLGESAQELVIVSKIEKPEALADIDNILLESDAIMVARGDLGVELPPEAVPNVQEELVDAARARNKPVIVATQMLESMIENARPTRAEVTDVANAVRSGADAVMLSGETAAGAHPVAAVVMMDQIVRRTESYLWQNGAFGGFDRYTPTPVQVASPTVESAVADATALLSRELGVRGIITLCSSGRSAAVMSAARPAAPIVGVCAESARAGFALGRLAWGVLPLFASEEDRAVPEALARRLARELGLAEAGQRVLLVAGFSADPEHNMPSVTILTA